MTGALPVLASWAESRWAMTMDAQALARRRLHLWRRLQPVLSRTPAFRNFVDHALQDFPVITPAQMRADYGAYNSLGAQDATLRALAARGETGDAPIGGIAAGYSTGTSGVRGLFVTNPDERARYLGQSIARLLPASALVSGARIALVLRANNALYSDVGRGSWRFLHLPPHKALEADAHELRRFAPDILIAPSHVLAALGQRNIALPRLRRCFYGAEPMGDAERETIGSRLGIRPDPIYQATEGFLGAACRLGRLHLNDHTLEIELAKVEGTRGFRPIVTDLHRTSQPIVRVLLDDFLELDTRPCSCGFVGRTIMPVQGRVTDLWRFSGQIVTPGDATAAIERVLGPDAVWSATASPCGVQMTAETVPDAHHLGAMLASKLNLSVPITLAQAAVPPPSPKRQRIRWVAA